MQNFNIAVTSSVVESVAVMQASIQVDNGMFACADAKYQTVKSIPMPMSFLSLNEYLPLMEKVDGWYCSPTCILLIDNDGTPSIQSGFLARWEDEDHLFWYEDNAVENVVGWMPYLSTYHGDNKLDNARKLLSSMNDHSGFYWVPNLSSMVSIPDVHAFLDVGLGIPPLVHENDAYLFSDVCMINYVYHTVNGEMDGFSTSRLYLKKSTNETFWDDANYQWLHNAYCSVAGWKCVPDNLKEQFNRSKVLEFDSEDNPF